MKALSHPMPVTRRRLLLMGTALAALVLPAVRWLTARDGAPEFVIVNGWVLKRDDLRRR